MTGVKSKHAFLLRQKQYDADIAEETAEAFAVVVCDVNGLKHINDTLGHKAGDEYIVKASREISEIFAHSPVYRTGGDEFVALLKGRDYLIRRELLLALHDRSVAHIGTGGVVISGGLSEYDPAKDTSFHDVFERADALMYEEKKRLKGMGAITRDGAGEAGNADFTPDGGEELQYSSQSKTQHLWAPFPPPRCLASVNDALHRLPPLRLAGTKNPSHILLRFRMRIV